MDCPSEKSSTIDIKGPKIKLPKLDINIIVPKIGGIDCHDPRNPNINKDGPKINLQNLDNNIKSPKLPGVDIHETKNLIVNKNGPKIDLANLDINIKGPKIGDRIDMNLPKIGSSNSNDDKKGQKNDAKIGLNPIKIEVDEMINKIIHRPKICTDEYWYGTSFSLFSKKGISTLPPMIEFPKKNINIETPKIETNVDIKQSKSALEIILLFELENNDLIILCKDNKKYDIYNILIYRFENKEYFLFEIIKYQNGISIEKLMKNRFLVYNNGYEIYSLNKNKEYSLILKEDYPK